jgi:hypothetical protein
MRLGDSWVRRMALVDMGGSHRATLRGSRAPHARGHHVDVTDDVQAQIDALEVELREAELTGKLQASGIPASTSHAATARQPQCASPGTSCVIHSSRGGTKRRRRSAAYERGASYPHPQRGLGCTARANRTPANT